MISKTNPLYVKADLLTKEVYKIIPLFPKSEMYALCSQLRRAVMSVILNIIEGFARRTSSIVEYRRFLVISFGSLEETRYILEFSHEQKYISDETFRQLHNLCDEVAKILWTIIHSKD